MRVQVKQRREERGDEAEGKEGRMKMRMKKEGVVWSEEYEKRGKPRREWGDGELNQSER